NWYPKHMKYRMVHWIENLNWDWCISRQRHFGIPFPVWRHKETGELILPSVEELPVDPLKDVPKGYTKEEVVPETDVMDTWATSALTPILALERHGLSHDNLPMDLRPQAHDIIRTWAFYTMIRHKYELDTIPWKNIMISGYVLASKGEKMSKSKGNSVTPREVLAKYSADILRFWAAGSKLGEDLPYKEQDLDAGKRFVTKMWNSFKFLDFFLSQNPDFDPHSKVPLVTQDLWLLHKVDTLIEKNTKDFEKYEYDKVKYRTEQFFWTVFCDSYIEIVKDRLYKPEVYGVEAQQSGLYTYYHVFKALLTMVHPFVPFVTESIWQYGFRKFESELSIVDAAWPALFSEEATEQQILAGQLAIDITAALRKHKSDNKKSLNTAISLTLGVSEDIKTVLESVLADIKGTAKATEIILKDPKDLRKDIVLGEALSEETTVEADEEDTPKELGLVVMDVDFVEEST
ncbi:MAG: class I tRNA ligase family protein, partial [Candidatus Woesearchaeota archaeon]